MGALRNVSNVPLGTEMLKNGDKLISTCKDLCSLVAPSGRETSVLEYIKNRLFLCGYSFKVDNMGNLIAHKKLRKKAKNVAFFAHMDSAGIIITRKTKKGEIYWGSLSNWTSEKINNQPIVFDNGGEGVAIYSDIPTENIIIDNVNALSVGAFGVLKPTIKVERDYLVGTFLDDRVGCAVLINLAEQISYSQDNIFFIFTTQEEIGNRGALAVLNSYKFDECYIIDTTKCDTSNYGDGYVHLGEGPTYKICDGAGLCSIELIQKVRFLQTKYKLAIQAEVLTYAGSDIAAFVEKGDNSLFLGISLPCENMHTREEMMSIQDVKGIIRLLKLILKEYHGTKYYY